MRAQPHFSRGTGMVDFAELPNACPLIMGRQKLKKSFQYEVKWCSLNHKFNTWVLQDELLGKGYMKLVQQFDDLESSREGAGSRDTSAVLVRKHLEDIGLDGDIAQYNEISGLSGGRCHCLDAHHLFSRGIQGQKIKLVIAACLWNNPQVSKGPILYFARN